MVWQGRQFIIHQLLGNHKLIYVYTHLCDPMSIDKFNDLSFAASPYALRPGLLYRLRALTILCLSHKRDQLDPAFIWQAACSSYCNASRENMEFIPGPFKTVANRNGAVLRKSIR